MAHRTRTHELRLTELPIPPQREQAPRIDARAMARLHHEREPQVDHRGERHRMRIALHDIERGIDPEDLPDPVA